MWYLLEALGVRQPWITHLGVRMTPISQQLRLLPQSEPTQPNSLSRAFESETGNTAGSHGYSPGAPTLPLHPPRPALSPGRLASVCGLVNGSP